MAVGGPVGVMLGQWGYSWDHVEVVLGHVGGGGGPAAWPAACTVCGNGRRMAALPEHKASLHYTLHCTNTKPLYAAPCCRLGNGKNANM